MFDAMALSPAFSFDPSAQLPHTAVSPYRDVQAVALQRPGAMRGCGRAGDNNPARPTPSTCRLSAACRRRRRLCPYGRLLRAYLLLFALLAGDIADEELPTHIPLQRHFL